MKLGERVTYPGLEVKWCPCVGVSLCSLLHVPGGFSERASSEMSRGHIFPGGVLAAITLVGGRAGDGGARAKAKCELGLLLCSMAATTLLGAGAGPNMLEQKP